MDGYKYWEGANTIKAGTAISNYYILTGIATKLDVFRFKTGSTFKTS